MRKHRLNKKAFTLVELCIVIALISIVTLLMTSFMAIFQPRTAQNQVRHDFLDEVALVRDEMQKWVGSYDSANSVIIVPEDDAEHCVLYKFNGYHAIRVTFSANTLSFVYSTAENNRTLDLNTIEGMDLEVYSPELPIDPEDTNESGDQNPVADPSYRGKLLKCTLYGFDVYGQRFEQSFLFALRTDTAYFSDNSTSVETPDDSQ